MLYPFPNKRHLCSELVSVACANGSEGPKVVLGNLEEIGEWSALVLSQVPIWPGSDVHLRGKGPELQGLVESCVREDQLGFFITLRLNPASRWSKQWFAPEHLLELPGYDESLSAEPPSKAYPLRVASGY